MSEYLGLNLSTKEEFKIQKGERIAKFDICL